MKLRDFKTEAWQSKERAVTYHQSTLAGPAVFQFVRHSVYLSYVQKHARPGARILDLGCGSGLLAIALHDLGYDVVACDVSAGMLEVLDQEKGARNIELRQGDGFSIPAKDGEFDLTLSRMFIQHFIEWPLILGEKSRVTRPGGVVMFDFGNQEHVDASGLSPKDDTGFPYRDDPSNVGAHYAVATEQAMARQAASHNLDVVEISPTGLLLYNGFLWSRLKGPGVEAMNNRLNVLLQSKEACELLALIETTLLPLLPKSVTYGNMTVLKKKHDGFAAGTVMQ